LLQPPGLACTLLTFIEDELASTGCLECLRRLLERSAIRAEACKRRALIAQLLACCEGRGERFVCVGDECDEACAALTLLLQDEVVGPKLALQLLPLRWPARLLKCVAAGRLSAARAYKLLRHMTEQGGLPLARDIWQNVGLLTLSTPGTLRAALTAGTEPHASAAEQEWRLLLLAVLQQVADRADMTAWAHAIEPQQLLSAVEDAPDTSGHAAAAASALADLSQEAFHAVRRHEWPVPERFRKAVRSTSCPAAHRPTCLAAASAKAQAWQTQNAHRQAWRLSKHLQLASFPQRLPRGRGAAFLTSSPVKSAGRWQMHPELADELNESSPMKTYAKHH